jgi:hypothetical protein
MPYELVEEYVGPSDGPGEESFCLTVCTPAALGSWGRGSSRITGPGAGYAPTGSGAYGPAARWSGTAGLT